MTMSDWVYLLLYFEFQLTVVVAQVSQLTVQPFRVMEGSDVMIRCGVSGVSRVHSVFYMAVERKLMNVTTSAVLASAQPLKDNGTAVLHLKTPDIGVRGKCNNSDKRASFILLKMKTMHVRDSGVYICAVTYLDHLGFSRTSVSEMNVTVHSSFIQQSVSTDNFAVLNVTSYPFRGGNYFLEVRCYSSNVIDKLTSITISKNSSGKVNETAYVLATASPSTNDGRAVPREYFGTAKLTVTGTAEPVNTSFVQVEITDANDADAGTYNCLVEHTTDSEERHAAQTALNVTFTELNLPQPSLQVVSEVVNMSIHPETVNENTPVTVRCSISNVNNVPVLTGLAIKHRFRDGSEHVLAVVGIYENSGKPYLGADIGQKDAEVSGVCNDLDKRGSYLELKLKKIESLEYSCVISYSSKLKAVVWAELRMEREVKKKTYFRKMESINIRSKGHIFEGNRLSVTCVVSYYDHMKTLTEIGLMRKLHKGQSETIAKADTVSNFGVPQLEDRLLFDRATVSGKCNDVEKGRSYLSFQIKASRASDSGAYTCYLKYTNGQENQEMSSVSFSVSVHTPYLGTHRVIRAKGARITLVPQSFARGKPLTVMCNVTDASNMADLNSVSVNKKLLSTNKEVVVAVATRLKNNAEAYIVTRVLSPVSVKGVCNDSDKDKSYVMIMLKELTKRDTGLYTCEISYVTNSGKSINAFASKVISVGTEGQAGHDDTDSDVHLIMVVLSFGACICLTMFFASRHRNVIKKQHRKEDNQTLEEDLLKIKYDRGSKQKLNKADDRPESKHEFEKLIDKPESNPQLKQADSDPPDKTQTTTEVTGPDEESL